MPGTLSSSGKIPRCREGSGPAMESRFVEGIRESLCQRVRESNPSVAGRTRLVFLGEELEVTPDQKPLVDLLSSCLQEVARVEKRHRDDEEALARLNADLRKAEQQVQQMAALDPVTQLSNRGAVEQILLTEIEGAKRNGTTLVSLVLNVGNLPAVQGALGHAVGDILLSEVARRIRAALRPTDHVGRIGESQFLVLLPETRLAEGIRVGERLRLAIRGRHIEVSSEVASQPVGIDATVEAISVPMDTGSISDLLGRGSRMGLRAGSTDKVPASPAAPTSPGTEPARPLSELADVLRRGEGLRAVSQPIIRVADETHIGYEFLTRTRIREFENPADFFRFAYDQNILPVVDRHCLRTCVEAAAAINRSGQFHINVFPSTILDTPVRALVQFFPVEQSLGKFCIEISEQQILGDPACLLEPIQALRSLGILIAIDDVGFGRSCLESLILLEPDIIKIDRRFIKGISQSVCNRRLLQRLLRVANSLGAGVVAEGVEVRADLEALIALGVEYAQGYLWGRPA